MSLSLTTTLPLLSSHRIPILGFGVFESPPHQTTASVTAALKSGYRHFDTAQYYENESEVGKAILASSVPRSDLFVTTKILSPVEDDVEKTFDACVESVKKSGLGYLDLFLIHTPSSGPKGREIMWTALERLVSEGWVKSIGVSNFGVRHITEIIDRGATMPSVNQIELHPFCQQSQITEFCQEKGIVVEAYCPLTRGERFTNAVLVEIGERVGKSVPQVLTRWSLQRGFVPLPKSDNPVRIASNAEVFDFELSKEDMQKIDALNENKSIFHNPVDAE